MKRSATESHLACVVPLFNEAGHGQQFLQALHAFAAERFAHVTLVAVDDGSKDATAAEVQALIAQGLPIRFLRLSRNFGKEIALSAGLEAAGRLPVAANAVLIMDADFQHPLEVAGQMITRWEQGIDMIYGAQQRANTEGLAKRAGTWLFYRLMRTGQHKVRIPEDAGDFRLMDQRVLEALNRFPERTRYMKGLYAWVGFTTEGIVFTAAQRAGGRSSFGFGSLGSLALDGLTAFTSWPLRMASIAGLGISMLAFSYGSWIIFERLFIGQPVPGFATLATAIMFFSGIQLLSIGLLGEYISRIFLEVKGRPLYLIAEEQDGSIVRDSDDLKKRRQ